MCSKHIHHIKLVRRAECAAAVNGYQVYGEVRSEEKESAQGRESMSNPRQCHIEPMLALGQSVRGKRSTKAVTGRPWARGGLHQPEFKQVEEKRREQGAREQCCGWPQAVREGLITATASVWIDERS